MYIFIIYPVHYLQYFMNKIRFIFLLILCTSSIALAQPPDTSYQPMKMTADHFFITCRVEKKSSAEAGIIFMENANPHISLLVKNRKLTLQTRDRNSQDAPSVTLSNQDFPVTIRLERRGTNITAYYAPYGQPMQVIREVSRPQMQVNDVKISGKYVTNIRFTQPASDPEDGVDKNKVVSRLEVLDIETGLREVVYEEQRHFEAPNWSPDGNFFVINSKGLLYRLPIDSNRLIQIDTDFADQINNDHGISPDGTRLVISHASEELTPSSSIISTLPIEGGKLTQITPNSPSYWHGWSPDGQTLAYTARREENFDIYTILADGSTSENRLTIAEGLDDGPDYTPDGQYIYFNSERSGSMEIWRMKNDGNEQEQITDDRYNNWFPHPSPDGKWIIFLSYEPEIPPGSHPANKKVMLRILPADGKGTPKVLAYLFGGQGTINVPSWSPDSKKVAFVSYTYE